MNLTKQAAAKAFTRWEKDYRKDPKQFMASQDRKSTEPKSLGELYADTFFTYLKK
jgi:hypothetical protein